MSLRQFISARKILRSLNFFSESATMLWDEVAVLFGLHDDVFFNPKHKHFTKPVSVILIGAGHRGSIYAEYAQMHPEEMKIVAVADNNPRRRRIIANKHNIPDNLVFTDWKQVFEKEKFADAIIIATPDHLHTVPCLTALDAGYDILLEKPIAPTEEECRLILQKSIETNRIVGVCHVLRYSPYFRELKEILDAGLIGDIISIQHMEPIGHIHMSHSYVRGKWRNSKVATPIILAKSSHDTDILRWLANSPVNDVHCFGQPSLVYQYQCTGRKYGKMYRWL